jgi:hypothetical protein
LIARFPSSANHETPGTTRRWTLYLLWIAVFVAVPIWASFDTPAWDVAVYGRAVEALRAGHDPYSSAMAVQTATHLQGGVTAGVDPPYSYVYSPMTLPVLRVIAEVPRVAAGTLYWLIYVVGVLALAWVGMQSVEGEERRGFWYLAPLAAFFPGLLANGTVLGGNVAYILYAAVLVAAVMAWRGRSWSWFYLAVVVASCVKAPLLSLVVLPVFTARKQWLPAISTCVAGAVLFVGQRFVWPGLFAHYIQAVSLQFAYNRDFGCSPAGLLSGLLYDHHVSYTVPAALFYLGYAVPILGTLFYLSRLYLRGLFSLEQWVPVLLVGVILLNPRLIEYDVAPLALPLALIGWRGLRSVASRQHAGWIAAAVFLLLNAAGLSSWTLRKAMDGPLLVLFFAYGSYALVRDARAQRRHGRGELHVMRAAA